MEQNILDEVYNYMGRFIAFPSEHAKVATVAYVAYTYLTDAFYYAPRLTVLSPEKRSGKTRLLEIVKLLVQNPIGMVSPSPASLYTLIDGSEITPTLLIDEIGRILERKDIADFLAIVEAGFHAGQTVPRVTFDSNGKRKVEHLKVSSPMLMAGIDNGRLPDTIVDRSIILRMRRNIGKKLSYRPRKHAAEGQALATKLAEWARDNIDKAKNIEPFLPDELNDREQDKYEPLFIVGQLADMSVTDTTDVTIVTDKVGWVSRIKRAALELSKEDKDIEPSSNSELLLKDIYNIFNNDVFADIQKMKTVDLLEKLNGVDESPWSAYLYGKPLDGRGLAKLLKPHHIRPKPIRVDEVPEKGYYRSDFEDAWKRYLEVHPETTVTSVTEVTPVTRPIMNLGYF